MAIFTPNSSQPSAKQELLSYIIGAVMLAVLIYGCVQFYDADFRDCASGYSGNCGKFHSAAEYRAFSVWQTAVLIGWPIGVGVLIFLQRNRLSGGLHMTRPKRPRDPNQLVKSHNDDGPAVVRLVGRVAEESDK